MKINRLKCFCLAMLINTCLLAQKTLVYNSKVNYEFVENKGQFDKNVLFKANVEGGAMFLEDNCWTYVFRDEQKITDIHLGKIKNTGDIKINHHAYKVLFINSNPHPILTSSSKKTHYYNYFLGKDPQKWASNVNAFEKILYSEIYPRIDIKVYSHQGSIKYDWIVQPGGDPNDIVLKYEGVDKIKIKNEELKIKTSISQIIEEKPIAYQIVENQKIKVNCEYKLINNILTFNFPDGYNKKYSLVIDPRLIFSTYSGSVSTNFGNTATFDESGFLYSGSTIFGIHYPTTVGAFQTTWAGGSESVFSRYLNSDIAISKFDTTGQSMIFSTFLGGSNNEVPHSMIVNENYELYVYGTTGSYDFPTTSNAYDKIFNSNSNSPVTISVGIRFLNSTDIFVSKFNVSGSNLVASTYLGGSKSDGITKSRTSGGPNLRYNYADELRGEIDLDNDGNVFIASSTESDDFPINNGFQTTKDANSGNILDGIIVKFSPNLDTIIWSSYLGGTDLDAVYSIAIDKSNDIYVTGGTVSTDFPTTSGCYDTSYNGDVDAFITYIKGDGSQILNSTYFGSSSYEQSFFVEISKDYYPHIYGQVENSGTNFIYNANYNNPNGGQFITKFHRNLDSLEWSTTFGTGNGRPNISPTAFLVDICNSIYIGGWGSPISRNSSLSSTGLQTTSDAYSRITDGGDFYFLIISSDASTIKYGTFFGGTHSHDHVDGGTSRFDKKGRIYQTVCSSCGTSPNTQNDFPTTPNAFATSKGNGAYCNAASFKMDFDLPIIVSSFRSSSGGCAPFTVNFQNISKPNRATTYLWDFGDGNSSNIKSPSHTYNNPGIYNATLIIQDTGACNVNDTLEKQITVLLGIKDTLKTKRGCKGDIIQIGINNSSNLSGSYIWVPTTGLSDASIENPTVNLSSSIQYILVVGENGICNDTFVQTVVVNELEFEPVGDTLICDYEIPIQVSINSPNNTLEYLWSSNLSFNDTLNVFPNTDVTLLPQNPQNYYYIKAIDTNNCDRIDTFGIDIIVSATAINASFSATDTIVCISDTVNFTNSTTTSFPFITLFYNWFLPDGTNSDLENTQYLFTQKGINKIGLASTDTSVCFISDTFWIDVKVDADSNYKVNEFVCLSVPSYIGPLNDSNYTYLWQDTQLVSQPDTSNPTVEIKRDTSLTLIISDQICHDTVTVNVKILDIWAETGNSLITCSSLMPIEIKGSSKGSGYMFVWSNFKDNRDTINNDIFDSTAIISLNTNYDTLWFTVASTNNCKKQDSLIVYLSDRSIDLSSYSGCKEDTISVKAINKNPLNKLTYSWTPTTNIVGNTDTNEIEVYIRDTFDLFLMSKNDSNCIELDTITVNSYSLGSENINIIANPDSVIKGFSTEVIVEPNVGDYSFSWSPDENIQNPNYYSIKASPLSTTFYTVTVYDNKNNCSYEKSKKIKVYEILCAEPEIFVPKAFSPNNDGKNDILYVRGDNIKSMEFEIRSRWGELFFSSKDKKIGWDGTFKGIPLNQSTVVYTLKTVCIDEQEYFSKGDILILK